MKFTRAMLQGLAPPPGWLPASHSEYRDKLRPGIRRIANMQLSKRASDLLNDYLGHGPAGGRCMSRLLSSALEAYLGHTGGVAVERKAAVSMETVRREWGCPTDDAAITLALRWLAQETMAGRVKRIVIDDEEINEGEDDVD